MTYAPLVIAERRRITLVVIGFLASVILPSTGQARGADEFIKVDTAAVMIRQTVPEYPEQAKKNGIFGEVLIRALISKAGEVDSAEVTRVEPSGQGFAKAALAAAYQCRYKPAQKDGKPVAIWVSYRVVFALDEKKSTDEAERDTR